VNQKTPNTSRWLVALVILGVILRLVRYALNLPMWMDECLLGVNILDHRFRDLAQPMEYVQIAPIGFLYAERAMFECFGMSELIMRLLPTLAGIMGLVLFACWTHRLSFPKTEPSGSAAVPADPRASQRISTPVLDPLAAILATGILAASDLSIRHAVELKPYGFDLLMAVLLWILATQFLLLRQRRWLILLIFATPVALVMSLPAIFVAAGILLALLLTWPRMTPGARSLTALLGLVIAAVFLLLFHRVLAVQYHGAAGDQLPLWAWPPFAPIAFIRWFIHTHADNFFAYPIDISYPWAGACFILLVLGAIQLFRNRRGIFAALVLLPFLMNLGGAMLRRYPYADSPRIGQHLAPAICLLIGVGAAALIRTFVPTGAAMRNVLILLFIAAVILGLSGPLALLIQPTSALRADRSARQFVRGLLRQIPPDATVAVLQPANESSVLMRWYLHEWPGRIVWNAQPADLLRQTSTPIWFISTVPNAESESDIQRQTGRAPSQVQHIQFGSADDGCCDLYVYQLPP
jgi:hypothetical protein